MGAIVGAGLAVPGPDPRDYRNPLGSRAFWVSSVLRRGVTGTALLGPRDVDNVFALIGAVLAVLLVLALRASARGIVPLILGAVISAVLYAYINAMVLLKPTVFDSYRY